MTLSAKGQGCRRSRVAPGGRLMSPQRTGRPPITTAREIERVALELFSRRGVAETTVDDIAVAAGISRRTFFRYFPSKNDVVWGDFDGFLHDLEEWLDHVPSEVPMFEALRNAVVRFNT